MTPESLTIRHAQTEQPWTVPYGPEFIRAREFLPQLDLTHAILHAQKSLGKLAAAAEAADHSDYPDNHLRFVNGDVIKDMAADLVTAALRIANLRNFDLATELMRRVAEKNTVGY